MSSTGTRRGDRHAAGAHSRRGAAPASAPHGLAPARGIRAHARRSRVAVRLAQRQVRRTWASSLLIVALVALPIAAMAGAAVYVASLLATPQERVTAELGRMQAWVQAVGVPDAGMWQNPEDPWWNGYPFDSDGNPTTPEGEVATDPFDALPAGTETIAVSTGTVRMETATGVGRINALAGDIADPRFEGRYWVTDGRAPRNDREVLVTASALGRFGVTLGGEVHSLDTDEDYTVVGTFRSAGYDGAGDAIAFADADTLGTTTWFLPAHALSWADVQELNDGGVVAFSREVVLDPPPFEQPDGTTGSTREQQNVTAMLSLLAALGVGGVAAAYVVVMLAGAAFAVSARRQQRSLAIAASVGADAKDLRRVIRLQGATLGLVGGAVGILLGVALAALVFWIASMTPQTPFAGFHVPWWVLVLILVFAVGVGTASALMPARTVAKTDALSALRGVRKPQTVRASRPIWGSIMLIVGVAITVLSGIAAAAVTAAGTTAIAWDSPLRWLPTVGIIAGPIIAQLGIILSGRWLLHLASGAMSHGGVSARVASRDAVANASRTVPAFAAIGATVFVGVFAAAFGSMATGQTARNWTYEAPVGGVWVQAYPTKAEGVDPAAVAGGVAAARKILTDAGATATTTASQQQTRYYESPEEVPAGTFVAVALRNEDDLLGPAEGYGFSGQYGDPRNNIIVTDAAGVELSTGLTLTSAQRDTLDDGGALAFDDRYVTDGEITVASWTQEQWIFGGAPSNIFRDDPDVVDPQWKKSLPATVVSSPIAPYPVVIAPATARELGLEVVPVRVDGDFPGPVGVAELDAMRGEAEVAGTEDVDLWVTQQDAPPGTAAWLVPLLAAVSVLVLGASAVALGLARFERRPDDATLAALGGTASVRRRIGFWQGPLIAGFGTFAGAVAGILPAIGFWLSSRGAPQGELSLADIPWLLLVVLAVALPLGIALVSWLIPPRKPDLTRRTAIA